MTHSKTASPARRIVLAALFLALAFVLPMITGHVPQVGNMLCPMHFPILLCGFVLGGPWGLAVGFVAPLLRSVLFGMPPMFPIAVSMAFELAAYGLVSGVMYWRRVKHTLPMMHGRPRHGHGGRPPGVGCRPLCSGQASPAPAFPFSAFLSGALAHRHPRHRGAAGAHPADPRGTAKGRDDGLRHPTNCRQEAGCINSRQPLFLCFFCFMFMPGKTPAEPCPA